MEQCGKCQDYRGGQGSKKCLKCEWYRKFKMKFSPRSKISFDHLPQMLMESIADDSPDYPEIRVMVRNLPDDLAAVITLKYYAERTWETVADMLHISQATAIRRKDEAFLILRKAMIEK